MSLVSVAITKDEARALLATVRDWGTPGRDLYAAMDAIQSALECTELEDATGRSRADYEADLLDEGVDA